MIEDNYRQRGLRNKLVKKLRQKGILDEAILSAVGKVPRHVFFDDALLIHAYEDKAFPIGEGQTISQPYTVAFQTGKLSVKPGDKVLEIGTGSGYQTALVAELCFNVFSVEKLRVLSRKARTLLDQLEYQNIALHVGDGTIGWSEHAPYDAIIVSAGSPSTPKPLLDQLSSCGRLVIPVGDEQNQTLLRVTRTRSGFEQEQLGECKFVKLFGKYGWRD